MALLLTANLDLNVKDVYGYTLLYMAVEKEHSEIVAQLLDAGANPHIPKKDGKTPLGCAAAKEDSKTMERILLAEMGFSDIPTSDSLNFYGPGFFAALPTSTTPSLSDQPGHSQDPTSASATPASSTTSSSSSSASSSSGTVMRGG